MEWISYRIRTIPAAEDLIVDAMSELGLCGAQIEDNVPLTAAEKERIYTYDAEDPVNDGVAYVTFYTEKGEDDGQELLTKMRKVLEDLRRYATIGDGTVEIGIRDDADWKDKWKQFFHSFMIDDVLIAPTWEEITEKKRQSAKYLMRIDPGTAFGTGAHETTQLSVRALRKETDWRLEENRPPSLLDVGTGSGVLSILSLMFGASFATGVDVDPFTKDAVRDNLDANHIPEDRFCLILGNLIEDAGTRQRVKEEAKAHGARDGYDLIVCNILPVVLIPLIPVVTPFLAPGGTLILSGILAEKEEEMRKVLISSGCYVQEVTRQGEWIAMRTGFTAGA